MSWLTKFLSSSIGRKLLMSLTGIFLITFLPVHLIGNLQLLIEDGGVAFNEYAELMTNNPVIKTVSYGLYFFILLHMILGVRIWLKNKSAKGSKYAVASTKTSSFSSRNMGWLGNYHRCFHHFTHDSVLVKNENGYTSNGRCSWLRASSQ